MVYEEDALKEAEAWYDALPRYHGYPSRGTLAAGLVVIDQLKEDYNLDIKAHLAHGGAQIKGLSKGNVNRIMAEHNETRPLTEEVGRTNRGNPIAVEGLLNALGRAQLEELEDAERNQTLSIVQGFIVEKIAEFHNRKRISFVYDENMSLQHTVGEIMKSAYESGKADAVAQYLVGAKLRLRYQTETSVDVSNDLFTAGDVQTGRQGDFEIGDTVFHVSIKPSEGHFAKCKRNLERGKRVYMIVSGDVLNGVRVSADMLLGDLANKVSIVSIESFVAQNIDELAVFSKEDAKYTFHELLNIYNQRVDEIESDKSKLIDIPSNL